ncbi:MAG: hypothetical protein WDO15_17500 [Bacteroidota bacterium]
MIGGVGFEYNLGNVRLVFDASYHKGMSNIANVNNRFSNDRLSGIGDAQDDLKTKQYCFLPGSFVPAPFPQQQLQVTRIIMKRLFTILFVFGFVACKNEADPEADKSFFTKFYDDSNFNINLYTAWMPCRRTTVDTSCWRLKRLIDADGLDIRPNLVYIMKADEFGNFISENEFDINFNTLRLTT